MFAQGCFSGGGRGGGGGGEGNYCIYFHVVTVIKIDHCSEITLILLSNFLFFVLFTGFFSDRSDKKEATTDSIYILLTGHTELQSLFIVDRSVVCECPLDDVSLILVSAYFSFNILCYTPGCYNYFAFF